MPLQVGGSQGDSGELKRPVMAVMLGLSWSSLKVNLLGT